MTVYITYEFSDYGLWDMSYGKIFFKRDDAVKWSERHCEIYGYTLSIAELEIE